MGSQGKEQQNLLSVQRCCFNPVRPPRVAAILGRFLVIEVQRVDVTGNGGRATGIVATVTLGFDAQATDVENNAVEDPEAVFRLPGPPNVSIGRFRQVQELAHGRRIDHPGLDAKSGQRQQQTRGLAPGGADHAAQRSAKRAGAHVDREKQG